MIVITDMILDFLKRSPAKLDFSNARRKLLASGTLSPEEAALLRAVSLKVHPKDDMYAGGAADAYLYTGISALRCIEAARAQLADPMPVRRVLDLPSGFGRVLRYLRLRFPNARITAAELMPEAVTFCAQTFGVHAVQSHVDFDQVNLPGPFDLIWCGSLFTHIDALHAQALLNFFHSQLAPGGLCLVTTHGCTSKKWIHDGVTDYGLSSDALATLLASAEQDGYGYADYTGTPGYGISIVDQARFLSMAQAAGNWRHLLFLESGWVSHHDVYAFTKARA
jgi:SAM-dependent methyltransferase